MGVESVATGWLLAAVALLPAQAAERVPRPSPAPRVWGPAGTPAHGGPSAGPARQVIATTGSAPLPAPPGEVRPPDDGLRGARIPARVVENVPPGILRAAHFEEAGPSRLPEEIKAAPTLHTSAHMTSARATSILTLEVRGPSQVVPGEVTTFSYLVRNASHLPAHEVQLEQVLPEGVRLISSEPRAGLQDRLARWDLGTLSPDEQHTLQLTVQVRTEKPFRMQPSVRQISMASVATRVIRPELSLVQTSPERVRRDRPMSLKVRVSNGSGRAIHRVVVRSLLPPGLHHPQGRVVETEIGTLEPGKSQELDLKVTPTRSGMLRSEVVALAELGRYAHSVLPIQVDEPALSLNILGEERQRIGQDVRLKLRLTRHQDRPPGGLVNLECRLPAGLSFVEASAPGVYSQEEHVLRWDGVDLPGAGTHEVELTLRGQQPGTFPCVASFAAEGLQEEEVTHEVRLEGPKDLELGLQALDNPLAVGEETVYEIRLQNRGTGTDRGLRLTVWLPEGVAPERADGPTGTRIQQQQVLFDAIPLLEPGATALYRLRARGQRPGAWRVRAVLSTEGGLVLLSEELAVVVRSRPEQPRRQ